MKIDKSFRQEFGIDECLLSAILILSWEKHDKGMETGEFFGVLCLLRFLVIPLSAFLCRKALPNSPERRNLSGDAFAVAGGFSEQFLSRFHERPQENPARQS